MTILKDIPLPVPPTDEEVKEWTLPAWKAVEPTLLSGLHPEILRLSIPTVFFRVPLAEVHPDWLECFDGKSHPHVYLRLVECGREALKHFPGGVFFKLDSRSPKDCEVVRFTAENIEELPRLIFSSERMLDDLAVERHHRDSIVLCFRQWVELGEEFRVFVKDRQVQGISRYDYRDPPKVEMTAERQAEIEARAEHYFAAINPHFPLDDFVFDMGEDVLIEINPYGLSDPCLFRAYENIGGFAA